MAKDKDVSQAEKSIFGMPVSSFIRRQSVQPGQKLRFSVKVINAYHHLITLLVASSLAGRLSMDIDIAF